MGFFEVYVRKPNSFLKRGRGLNLKGISLEFKSIFKVFVKICYKLM